MSILAEFLTVIALVLVQTAFILYQPRTNAGLAFYLIFIIPVSVLLIAAMSIVAQLGG